MKFILVLVFLVGCAPFSAQVSVKGEMCRGCTSLPNKSQENCKRPPAASDTRTATVPGKTPAVSDLKCIEGE